METVKVSQAPAVSEAPAVFTPAAGGATLVALLFAVQDLARFFLSLSGSSSLGVVGGVAGVAASAAEVGGSAVPFGFCRWCSRTWCCNCGSCWGGWFSFCSRCVARHVRPSAASGDLSFL